MVLYDVAECPWEGWHQHKERMSDARILILIKKGIPMKEPGLDNRHRDKDGQIQQKRSDTKNKNLPHPIPEFTPKTTLKTMREKTGKTSEKDIREAAKHRR